ncbi:hypothetical protein FRC15_001042 [Serendipita sp. 397]|nr:hypothetical protein FRC15_001042 [Serendipita sp. 397]
MASTVRPTSNGASFPARSSSRPGYTASGEPIGLVSGSPPGSASAVSYKRGPPTPLKDQSPPSSSSKDRERPPRTQPPLERERSRTMDQPLRSRSSKSRTKDTTPPPNLNKPQPPRPPPTPAAEAQPLPNGTYASPPLPGKRGSLQRMRPTSDFVNVAELGAQEVWEHDRMTSRGQSVYSPDGIVVNPATSQRASASSSLLLQGPPSGPVSGSSPGAGSSHTSFMIQPPFQQPKSAPATGGYYPQYYPTHLTNPLPAPPAIVPPKSAARNRI